MSNIFDALRKAQGDDASSFALPLIQNAGRADGAAARRAANMDLPQPTLSVPHLAAVPPAPQPVVPIAPPEPRVSAEEVISDCFSRIVVYTEPNSLAANRYRLLRMRLQELWRSGNLKTVLVTSPLPGDGKSTTALNLATALSEDRTRSVLLIDADLHRGTLSDQLGLKPHAGMTECLAHRRDPLSLIRRVEPFGWHLLSAGILRVESPTQLLQPQQLSTLFHSVASRFDWVVVDSPPVLPLTDAVALRQHVDGSLLVARANATSAKSVENAVSLLGKKNVVGIVLNGLEKVDDAYQAYYAYNPNDSSLAANKNRS